MTNYLTVWLTVHWLHGRALNRFISNKIDKRFAEYIKAGSNI